MKKTLIVLTILAGALASGQASVVLSDDFTYNNGPIAQPTAATINPSSTWLANSGAGELDVTNNILIVTSQRAQDGFHTLTGYPFLTNGPTTALYARFTLKCTFLPSAPAGAHFAAFGGTNQYASGGANVSGFRARLWASQTNYVDGSGVGVGQFRLGIVNSGYDANNVSVGNTNYVWPTPLDTNTTYTIVTKYVLATGASTLWVNPTAETDPSVTDPTILPLEPTSAPPVNGVLNISGYCFRQASGEGTMLIDDLSIGTSFSDVAGANQSPSVSAIAAQSIPMGGNTGPLDFTVSDPETAASALTVTATSDNLTLVPNGSPNIVLTSDVGGTNRTVTITPAAGQQGSATITVNVNDGPNNSLTTFKVTVGAPTIGSIPNQITGMSTATPAIPFSASDAENDALTFTKASSNPTLVTAAGIAVTGSSPNWAVTVTPQAGQSGVTTITLGVTDGYNTNYSSFKVTVPPAGVGLVYNEDFLYTGFDLPNALYNATGGSGATWTTVSGTAYQLQVTNGWAYIVNTNSEDLGAPFISSAAYYGSNGVVLYTSFTVNSSTLPSNAGEYFFHLSASADDSSNFRDKVFANKVNAATGKFRLAVANVANTPVQFARDLMLGATYAVVTRYNLATGDTVLWVNPTNEQNPGATASDNPGSSTIGGVALRESSGTGDLAVGPMKVGTSFSDVWTAPAQPLLSSEVDNSGNIILSWSNPLFVLQSAADVTGPFADVAPTSPHTNAISGQQYFRLRY